LASTHPGVDLLHIDIAACPRPLKQCVSYIVVGTHSRQIEERIFDSLLAEDLGPLRYRRMASKAGAIPLSSADRESR
jgi:hypothetical protein